MCNLAEGWARELKQELTNEQAVYLVELVRNGTLTILQAAKILQITEKEFEAYLN